VQVGLKSESFLFPSRIHDSPHLVTRRYARILENWVEELGLDPADYGTHSMRRTKATLLYRRTKNLRAVHFLFGHSKLESPNRQVVALPEVTAGPFGEYQRHGRDPASRSRPGAALRAGSLRDSKTALLSVKFGKHGLLSAKPALDRSSR
jgi:Phage integrase family